MTTTDFAGINYFRDADLYQDPYPYYEWLRQHGPVWASPRGVVYVTGYDEAIAVYHDQATWSNCNTVAGPFTNPGSHREALGHLPTDELRMICCENAAKLYRCPLPDVVRP